MKFKTYYFFYNLVSKLILIAAVGITFSGLYYFGTVIHGILFSIWSANAGEVGYPFLEAYDSIIYSVALILCGGFCVWRAANGLFSLPDSFHRGFVDWINDNPDHKNKDNAISLYVKHLKDTDACI